MEIRNFKKEDITQVLEICREVREHHINLLNGYFTPQNDTFEQSGFLASLDGTNYVALVAAQNDKIIGSLLAEKKIAPHLVHSKIAHICNFGVKANNRKTGVGKKLMDKFFELCKQDGIEEIYLGVYNDNTIAYNFYEKYGFKPIEQKMIFSIKQN
ncbi:MAG: GNAT family N-acetyltransferase [Alphaproteobacteria bacterium]|nr:GNAT family N-acetyltransferase [Alphaproteobacteria bacterium]